MRVLFGSFPAITVLGGGVETQVRALQRELKSTGCVVELFDPWRRYEFAQYDLFHLFGADIGTYHLGRAVCALGARIAVSPEFYSRHRPWRLRAVLKLGMSLRRRGGFWTEHVICRELCEMAEMLLPNTRAEAALVEHGLGVRGKVVAVLPNGVEERFADATPDEFASKYGSDFILYVGHIGWARKNLLALLRVVERMQYPTVLIGHVIDNAYTRKCMEIIRRSRNITLIPALEHSSGLLASAYAACSVLVLPSQYETPGLAALEAGLAGARVCITRHGGTTEYFGEYAQYLEPRSLSSISAAIKRALAQPKDGRLREHIAANYLWRHSALRAQAAYERLIREGEAWRSSFT
uniref:Glycosyltransferase n=1 Tax=candidate division WOR-3 bacterium TaxID=2052148 RepID=A0A7C4CC22_UNCW3